jgi:polyisoprenyl-phosphate glycosyltransferase
MTQSVDLSIIIPCYCEERNLRPLYERLKGVVERLSLSYEMVFVNDGSSDGTLANLKELASSDQTVKVLSFSRNFGHQMAVSAGLDFCSGSAAVIIDADLQDPPELIQGMTEKWREGYEVVYAVRTRRKGEGTLKLLTASYFYKFLKFLSDIDIPLDSGDFRLIDRKVIDQLTGMPERHRFLRGMVSWTGFKQIGLEYERDERLHGRTHYPLHKMIKFAVTGITSFSFFPLQLASYLGFATALLSFLYALYIVYDKLFNGTAVQGWSSLMVVVLFFGGVQLMTLGFIGEYIGRISDEVKRRPLYIVEERINL